MFRYAQHDSNLIQSTTRVPVILSTAKDLKANHWKEMFRYAQHDSIVIPNAKRRDPKTSTQNSPSVYRGSTRRGREFSLRRVSKKRKKRYLTFVRYDTVREPVILSKAKDLKANHWKEMFRCAQHDSNVIQSTTRVPVILSTAKDLKASTQDSPSVYRGSTRRGREFCLRKTCHSEQSEGSQKAEEKISHVRSI